MSRGPRVSTPCGRAGVQMCRVPNWRGIEMPWQEVMVCLKLKYADARNACERLGRRSKPENVVRRPPQNQPLDCFYVQPLKLHMGADTQCNDIRLENVYFRLTN